MNNTTPPPYRPKPKRSALRTVIRVMLALLLLAAYSMAVFLGGKTIFELWIPWSAAGLMAALSGIFVWKKWEVLSGTSNFFINYLLHAFCITGFAAALLFSLNYFVSDKDSESSVTATVVSSYSKTRYHTRRIGRRLSGRGRPYQVYYIEAELPDGRRKEFSVTLNQYNEARRSSKIKLDIENGLFSMPVIKESTILKAGKKRKKTKLHPVLKKKKETGQPE